jgi:type IV pilus assembly protein PilC
MKYAYKALTSGGKIIKGKIERKTPAEVADFIKEQKSVPVKITKPLLYFPQKIPQKISAKELSIRALQLKYIYSSGVPVIDSLRIFKDSSDLCGELLKGEPLSVALGDSYPNFFLDMVKIGEKSGDLPKIFETLSFYYENQSRRETQINNALIYPAIVFLFILLTFSIVCVFLAPAYVSVYEAASVPAPRFLTFLIDFFDNALSYFLSASVLIGLPIILIYLAKDKIELKIPIFKKEFNRRFALAFSILYESGVQIQDALRLTKNLTKNKLIIESFEQIDRRVAEGVYLSSALIGAGFFDPTLIELIKTGEKSGFLADALSSAAARLEMEVEALNSSAAKLVEPVMSLILGAMIFIIMAIVAAPAILLSSRIF